MKRFSALLLVGLLLCGLFGCGEDGIKTTGDKGLDAVVFDVMQEIGAEEYRIKSSNNISTDGNGGLSFVDVEYGDITATLTASYENEKWVGISLVNVDKNVENRYIWAIGTAGTGQKEDARNVSATLSAEFDGNNLCTIILNTGEENSVCIALVLDGKNITLDCERFLASIVVAKTIASEYNISAYSVMCVSGKEVCYTAFENGKEMQSKVPDTYAEATSKASQDNVQEIASWIAENAK